MLVEDVIRDSYGGGEVARFVMTEEGSNLRRRGVLRSLHAVVPSMEACFSGNAASDHANPAKIGPDLSRLAEIRWAKVPCLFLGTLQLYYIEAFFASYVICQ